MTVELTITPEEHYELLESVFEDRKSGRLDPQSDGGGPYAWVGKDIGKLEDARLELQNNAHGMNWAESNKEIHSVAHKMLGGDPTNVAVIGVGKGADLIPGLLNEYDGSNITVVEAVPEKTIAAQNKIGFSHSNDTRRLTWISGDAAKELPAQDRKFAVIDTQLVLVHLDDQPQKPLLGSVIKGVTESLTPGGLFVCSDLVIKPEKLGDIAHAPWKVKKTREYQGAPVDIDKANFFLHGDGNGFNGVLNVVWDAPPRFAHGWKSASDIKKVVEDKSDDKLRYIYSDEYKIPPVSGNEPFAIVMAHMGATLALQLQKALGENPNATAMLDKVWDYAEAYTRAIKNGAAVDVPKMERLIFQRK